MNNEIGRKLTSLTLMTIMVAGGMTFAIPGILPEAQASHNQHLFVSAESSQFDNLFNGPMVIEVVVNNPALSDTDEGEGEPSVDVNGNKLRMTQGTDGLWYGYFADFAQAAAADATQNAGSGLGLDFGKFCFRTDGPATVGFSLTETVGFTVARPPITGAGVDGAVALTGLVAGGCSIAAGTGGTNTTAIENHVVRENQTVNIPAKVGNVQTVPIGQIGYGLQGAASLFPIIQLYNFNPTGNVNVVYHEGTTDQEVILTFDTVDHVTELELDRSVYPPGAQIHATLTDIQLNIDPTDEDSWTWGSNPGNTTVFYQLFNENGGADADGTRGAQDLAGNLTTFIFESNGLFQMINNTQGVANDVIILADNADAIHVAIPAEGDTPNLRTINIAHGDLPVTFTESGTNTGVFTSYDENDVSNIQINTAAARGTSGTLIYDELSHSVVVGLTFATVDIDVPDGEWNSGELVSITIVDGDQNLNSRADEDFDFNNPAVSIIPALKIGSPFTLATGGSLNATIVTGLSGFPSGGTGSACLATLAAGDILCGNMRFGHPAAVAGAINPYETKSFMNAANGTVVQPFSDRLMLNFTNNTASQFGFANAGVINMIGSSSVSTSGQGAGNSALVISTGATLGDLRAALGNFQGGIAGTGTAGQGGGGTGCGLLTQCSNTAPASPGSRGLNLLNYDIRGINGTAGTIGNLDIYLLINDTATTAAGVPTLGGAVSTQSTPFILPSSETIIGNGVGNIRGFGSSPTVDVLPASALTIDSTNSILAISLVNSTTGALTGLVSLNSTSCSAIADVGTPQFPAPVADCITDKIFNASRGDGWGIGFMFLFNQTANINLIHGADAGPDVPIALDFFSFGITDEGVTAGERINNNIIRIEVEETADNTATFGGTLEYIMLTQANILNPATYAVLAGATIDDDPVFVVHEDLTDEDAPRVNYNDLGADGVVTQVADQEEAPSHSGVVSFDSNTYKIADTVVITLEDQDLNADSEVIDIYTVVPRGLLGIANVQNDGTLLGLNIAATVVDDAAVDEIGVTGFGITSDPTVPFGRILFVTFDDEKWFSTANFNLLGVGAAAGSVSTGSACGLAGLTPSDAANDGLDSTGFTLVETGIETGIFLGDFQIPTDYCQAATATLVSTTGTDLEVNYQDFRDASGEFIEVGDGAGIRANTGTISLDRTVYPVPWGALADFPAVAASPTPTSAGALRSLFPVHQTGVALGATTSIDAPEELGVGDVQVHIRINDPDFDTSATGEDAIGALFGNQTGNTGTNAFVNSDGPVKIVVTRGANTLVLATAGASGATTGVITTGINPTAQTRELGQIVEIAPDAGIFELDFTLRYTDGPADTRCPATPEGGYDALNGTSGKGGSFTRYSIGDDDVRAASVPGGVLGTAAGFPQLTAAQGDYCILQGDIITVEYRDPTDASTTQTLIHQLLVKTQLVHYLVTKQAILALTHL